MSIIQLKKLSKNFKKFKAVNHISFNVEKGEVFGFLGPNGAGKTTTLSMLATILKPSSGSAIIDGNDIQENKHEVRKSIGIVFQDPSLDEDLTAYENLIFHGVMYEVPKEIREKRIDELLKLVDLHTRKHHFVKTFSGGMKRRLEIARGLLHRPKVLFLDEPTLGLDPQTRQHIWNYIEKLNKNEKITILLTTHYMEEADKLCDRIAIIDHGKILALKTPAELRAVIGGEIISFESNHNKELANLFSGQKWVNRVKHHNDKLNITVQNAEHSLPKLLKLANKFTVSSVSIHKPTLEDAFLHYTGHTIREQQGTARDQMRIEKKLWTRK
jgi:ABC-2 type transport system ATP-binding protein